MTASDTAILVRASRLYYLEEKSQGEIAKMLGISRPGVSRLLTRARRERIVEIRIRDDDRLDEWADVASALGLRELHVARGDDNEAPRTAVGRLAARWLEDAVPRGVTLGLTAGTTLAAFVREVSIGSQIDPRIVPLIGSLWDTGEDFDGSFLCQELRRRAGGVHQVLSAPAIVATPTMASLLRAEPRVRRVLAEYSRLQVAVLGIASADREHPIVRAAMGVKGLNSKRGLLPATAVASVGRLFYDAQGRPLRTPLDARTIGISHPELLRVPTRVGLAAGTDKLRAVQALIAGRVINVLITDEKLAHNLKNRIGS